MTAIYIAPRVPVVDPRTGLCDPIWYRFFSMLFSTVGDGALSDDEAFQAAPAGQTEALLTAINRATDNLTPPPLAFNSPADDLSPVRQVVNLAADDLTPVPQAIFYSADDVLPAIMGLNAQIAMLRAELDDLRKGTVL